MASVWGASWGSSWGNAWGPIQTAEPVQSGGDDAYHHTGWNKRAWQKKQKREEALEDTIRAAYQRLTGAEPAPDVIEEVAQAAKQEAPITEPSVFVDYSGVSAWLQAQERIVSEIIARRQEEDDEEALIMLLM